MPLPNPGRPLIVCDVDEVVLGFIAALEGWLAPRDLRLARDSFALNGNIRHLDGTPVPDNTVGALLGEFFAACAHDLPPVPGANAALAMLAAHGDILFLTNLPATSAQARRGNLDRLGLSHPLIVNEGPKGPVLAQLASGVAAPIVFLDDSPNQITSAIEAVPHIGIIHLVPDAGFRRHIVAVEGVGLLTGDWDEASRYILAWHRG